MVELVLLLKIITGDHDGDYTLSTVRYQSEEEEDEAVILENPTEDEAVILENPTEGSKV